MILYHGEYHKIRSMVRMFILTKGGRLFFFVSSISTHRPRIDSETAKKDSKTAKKKKIMKQKRFSEVRTRFVLLEFVIANHCTVLEPVKQVTLFLFKLLVTTT